MNQITLTDIEYSNRKKKTRREEFLDAMEKIIPWPYWVAHTILIINEAADLLVSKPCSACISCRYGSICQMKESKMPSMIAMQCAHSCT